MKKILTKCFSIVAMLLCIATIASCVAVTSNTSIQINKFPEETYVKGSNVNEALENITITVYENSAQKASGNLNALKELGVNVEGFNLAQIGTYTAKISYGTATVAFTYTVVEGVVEVDSEEDFKFDGKTVALQLVANVELTKQINVPANTKVVLDLGNYTLTTDENAYGTDYLFNIPDSSSLEIKGVGNIINNKIDVKGIFDVYGELVIREGNYTDYSQTFTESNRIGALLMLNSSAQLTIYDGSFKSLKPENHEGHYGKEVLGLKNDSIAKIYGGKFYNDSTDALGKPYGAYAINSVGNLFIYGGQFDGARGAIALVGGQFDVRGGEFGKLGCKYRPIYCSGSESAVSGVISGGIFYANAGGQQPIYVSNPNKLDGGKMEYSSLVVSGGTFINAKGAGIYYGGKEYGSLLVQGGLFQTNSANIISYGDGASTAIVPGYEVVTKTVDGQTYYSVEKK